VTRKMRGAALVFCLLVSFACALPTSDTAEPVQAAQVAPVVEVGNAPATTNSKPQADPILSLLESLLAPPQHHSDNNKNSAASHAPVDPLKMVMSLLSSTSQPSSSSSGSAGAGDEFGPLVNLAMQAFTGSTSNVDNDNSMDGLGNLFSGALTTLLSASSSSDHQEDPMMMVMKTMMSGLLTPPSPKHAHKAAADPLSMILESFLAPPPSSHHALEETKKATPATPATAVSATTPKIATDAKTAPASNTKDPLMNNPFLMLLNNAFKAPATNTKTGSSTKSQDPLLSLMQAMLH